MTLTKNSFVTDVTLPMCGVKDRHFECLFLQTCAEETLAKAETALREREQQLIHLRTEHDALRAELAAVKEGLSTSTERAEKLREEGQVCALVP